MPKAKVSVTVEGSLLRQVDRMARGASRSEVFEDALASWLRNRRRERLEEEIELYYRSLGAAAPPSPARRAPPAAGPRKRESGSTGADGRSSSSTTGPLY